MPQIFVPQHWTVLIKNTSKEFIVHSMRAENFHCFSHLNNLIKDPKQDTEGFTVKFRNITYFKYTKISEAFSFEFKATLDEEFPFSKCMCSTTSVGRPTSNLDTIFSTPLYNNPIKIKEAKWNNLQSLLEYIPPIYHDYYVNMAHESKKSKKGKAKNKQTSNISVCNTPIDDEDSDMDAYEYDNIVDSDYDI
ncbi:hypothetical protein QE152_g36601 [Popillia japonica]|uniref:Uncharacterized protein n=1 Tax=Popillia japonica TaxID=7064 RepID=A0AAW1ID65_POPJA